MSTQEAADMLGMSASWLHRQRNLGDGPPYVRQGRKVFYRRGSLLNYLERQERDSSPQEHR